MKAPYTVQSEHAYGFNRSTLLWESVDVSEPINLLLGDYQTLEIGVESLEKHYTFFPEYHLAELMNHMGTLQSWFDTKAGIAFPDLKDGYPSLEFAYGHYQSLFVNRQVGYKLCPPNTNPDASFVIDDADDVIIEAGDDIKEYNDWMLYNVGGAWVRSFSDSWGVRLVGAGGVLQRLNSRDISMFDFKGIGKVITHPITEATVSRVQDTHTWYSNIIVNAGEDLTNKSVGVVIGGILHWIKSKQIIGSETVMLSLSDINMLDYLQYQSNTWDWGDIGLPKLDETINVKDLIASDTLYKLVTHKSSFVVVIDNPYLEFESFALNRTFTRGRYGLKDPTDPDSKKPLGYLVNTVGQSIYYWPMWEEGCWVCHTKERATPRLVSRSVKWQKQNLINAQRTIPDPVAWDEPYPFMVRIRARKK